MINLLPKIQFEELEKEKRVKIVLILGIISFSVLLAFSLILFSIKIISENKLEVQNIIFQQRGRELEIEKIKDKEKEIKKYNLLFSNLLDFYQNQKDIVEILEKIASLLPENSYLKSFKFKLLTEKDFIGEVSLTGFSPDRESLIKIKENIENEKSFSDLNFPVSNWASQYNIDFSLSFKVKK
jgi:Tfp pilus assembly protein PilN